MRRREMILQHLGLIGFALARHRPAGLPYDDAWQAGACGLIQAIDGYDPAKGGLTTYAVAAIQNEVKRAAKDARRGVSMSFAADLVLRTAMAIQAKTGELPDLQQIRKKIKTKLADETLEAVLFQAANPPAPMEYEPRPGAFEYQDAMLAVENRTYIAQMLSTLDAGSQRVLIGLYGLFGQREQTAAELADELGCAPAKVHAIRAKALRRLRYHFSE